MGQEIYNEGRVVGLSAYEMFLKNLFATDPTAAENPPTEIEWLSSMIGMGSSMVLKVPEGAQGINDYPLPQGSNLTAAGTIVASLFDGDCVWALTQPYWATKVISYGGLIANNSTSSPTASEVPADPTAFTDQVSVIHRKRLYAEFSKVTDGIFIQFGKAVDGWVETGDDPYKDLHNPDFEKQGVIRLYIEEPLTYPIYILFTGFINKGVLQGLTGTDGSTDPDTNQWRNGGMLGPAVFPWSSKILFTVPNGTYYADGTYVRTFPMGGEDIPSTVGSYHFAPTGISGEVKSHAVIDYKSINLNEYYEINAYETDPSLVDPRLTETVTAIALGTKDDVSAIAAWYPGMSTTRLAEVASEANPNGFFFPPALYGVKTDSAGNPRLIPLDTAAPGTIKVFEDATRAYNYTQQNPNNYAIYHTYDNNRHIDINYFVSKDSGPQVNTWQAMSAALIYDATDAGIDYTKIIAGDKSYETVSLSDVNGDRLPLTGAAGNYGINVLTSGFNWSDLLKALHNNYYIDPVGDKLRDFNVGLPNVVTTGNNYVSIGANTMDTPNTGAIIQHVNGEAAFNVAPKSGTNYYVFENGGNDLRLYISNTEPSTTGVPVGSIGIGW